MGAWCAQQLRTHQACARQGGLEKVACAPVHGMKRSCRDKAPRWPSDEGIHWVWRKGQQGGSAKLGSNLRRRSALELDGNYFSQEAKEVIPGGGTERSTQVMEPAPGDEGIGLRALRTDWTVTRQSERSGRAARGRKDVVAADLDEEHEASPRNHRRRQPEGSARESSTLGGRGVQILRTVASALPEWDSTLGDQSSARRPFNQSWQCRLNARSVRQA